MNSSIPSGCRVFVAEDEALVGMVLEDILDMLGCTLVANCATLADAEAASDREIDVAVLDVHLGDESVFPLADAFVARGVAVVFATGSTPDSLPARFAACPVLEKPYAVAGVEAALLRVTAVRQIIAPAG